MLSSVKPRISMWREILAFHFLQSRPVAEGLLVTKMVALGSSMPDRRRVKMEGCVSRHFGNSSRPSRMMKVLLPAVCLMYLAISSWQHLSWCKMRSLIAVALCKVWSHSLRRITSWYCWKSSPFAQPWQIRQAKVVFPQPGAPSTSTHSIFSPSFVQKIDSSEMDAFSSRIWSTSPCSVASLKCRCSSLSTSFLLMIAKLMNFVLGDGGHACSSGGLDSVYKPLR